MATNENTIGSGGDYATVEAWLNGTAGGPAAGDIEIGKLLDQDHVITAVLHVDDAAGDTSASAYRELRHNTVRYDPAQNTGPRIIFTWDSGVGTTEAAISIEEDFFRLTNVGLRISDRNNTSGGDHIGIKVEADSAILHNVHVHISEGDGVAGSAPTFTGIEVNGTVGDYVTDCYIVQCVVEGDLFGKGLHTGITFGSFTGDSTGSDPDRGGGCYGCAVHNITNFNGRAYLGNLSTSGREAPKLRNCIAINCASACVAGFWYYNSTTDVRGYSHNITSDALAIADMSGASGGADPDSLAYISSRVCWVNADAQDTRVREGGPASRAGVDLSTEYSALGIDALDIIGTTRSGNWNIGPWHGDVTLATSSPTETISSVGSGGGRDYATLQAWADALLYGSLPYRNVKLVVELYGDSAFALTASFIMEHVVTDHRHTVEIRTADGERFTTRAGAERGAIVESSTVSPLIDCRIPFVTMRGFAVRDNYAGTATHICLNTYKHRCLIDGVHVYMPSYTGATGILMRIWGSRTFVTNCIAKGTDVASTGPTRGIQFRDCDGVKVMNCVVYEVKTTAGTAYGIHQKARTPRCSIYNCVVTDCGSDIIHDEGEADVVQSHNITSDATAKGAGALPSTAYATVFQDQDIDDVRLLASSPALNSGLNLSALFSADIEEEPRYAPFSRGAYTGFAYAPLLPSSDINEATHVATLTELLRLDGTALRFTDCNHTIQYIGQLWHPVGGMNTTALRSEAGLQPDDAGVVGAITSDKITETALAAGLYRGSRLTQYRVDFDALFSEWIDRRVWWVDDVDFDENTWKANLSGIAHRMQQSRGERVTVGCGTRLGSDRCTIDLEADTQVDIPVDTVNDARREFTFDDPDVSASYIDDFFGWGEIVWLTGSHAGLRHRIKAYTKTDRVVRLEFKTPFDIEVGDKCNMIPGCRFRHSLDCVTKWANGVNYQGWPTMSGEDRALETPTR